MLLTDVEIYALIQESKPLEVSLSQVLGSLKRVKGHGEGHKEARQDILREDGSAFTLILRQNEGDIFDFSVILGFAVQNRKLFKLKRYNGKSHEHTNPLEDERFYDFHIHTATERYQLAASRKEEHYAELTDRYSEIHGALECMAEDCNISFPSDRQMDIFR